MNEAKGENKLTNRISREFPLTREATRLNVLANLFPILVDIYGMPSTKDQLVKIEGKEIIAHVPALHGSITFKAYGGRIYTDTIDSQTAIGEVWFNVSFDEIMPALADIIRTPHTLRGLLHLFARYLLRGKIKIKGYGPVLKIFKCFMCGKNPVYRQQGMNLFNGKEALK